MLQHVCQAILAVMLLVTIVSLHECPALADSGDLARARRLLTLVGWKGGQVSYTLFTSDLKLVAVAQEKESYSHLFLFDSSNGTNRLLWSKRMDSQWVWAVLPWYGPEDEMEGFLILTRSGGGRGYHLLFIAKLKRSVRAVLDEVGYGPPYMPDLVRFGRQNYQSIIVPDSRDYPFHPKKANIFTWNPKKRMFSKRVMAWERRFQSKG